MMESPNQIAALGDSVPWGQGLRDEHKYANQIATQFRPPGRVVMVARSGAIIGIGYQGEQIIADREVPVPTPTILDQIDQVSNPSNVDLVLLNGRINDVAQVIAGGKSSTTALRGSTEEAQFH